MKRIFALLVVGLWVGLVPRPALAQPVTTTTPVHGVTATGTGIDLCGTEYDLTITYDGVEQSREFDDGRLEVHVTVAGELLAEPTGGYGPTYTGRYSEAFGFRLNQRNGSFTWPIEIVATGSDGSTLRVQTLAHINETGSGSVLEFEFERCG